MITEDYVSFETAKLLKKKEFCEVCKCQYGRHGDISWTPCNNGNVTTFARPTHQMAMKWLREKHKLYIGINIEVGDIQMLPSYDFEETVLGYNFVIYNEETLIWVFKDKTPRSYEEAVETAIKYCLINLIN